MIRNRRIKHRAPKNSRVMVRVFGSQTWGIQKCLNGMNIGYVKCNENMLVLECQRMVIYPQNVMV